MATTTSVSDSTRTTRALYIAFDMGRDSWQFAAGDGGKTRRELKILRTDLAQGKRDVIAEIAKARTAFGLADDAPVHAVYEAGRDGFWFARWLGSIGVQCLVIDPCSILVDRRQKQRKNDAIDARALLDVLVRHVTGDRLVRPVAVPPPEAEDHRQLGRAIHRLGRDRRALATRLQSILWSRGIDAHYRTGMQEDFESMRTGEDRPLDAITRLELETLCAQLEVLDKHLYRLEELRTRQVMAPATKTQEIAQRLERLAGIGPIGSWTLAHELFGWREFKNAKHLGAFLGLAPTPFCSGQMQRDQGISKAGPSRLRALLVQLAWLWLVHQPDSALSKWYAERFGPTAKRSRRVGIVAVARKLAIALWRYAKDGVVPEGAALKPQGPRKIAVPLEKGCRIPHSERRKLLAA